MKQNKDYKSSIKGKIKASNFKVFELEATKKTSGIGIQVCHPVDQSKH